MYIKHTLPEYCMEEHNIDEISKNFYSNFIACMVFSALFGFFMLISICYCWWQCDHVPKSTVYTSVEMTSNPITRA
jgi:hypothetical protein